MRRFAVRCLVAAFAAAILAVGGGILWAWNGYRAPGPLEEATTLVVPKGAGVKEIADLLRDAGVIDNAYLFILGAQYKNCLLYTSPSPRDGLLSRMPSSA